MESQKCRKGKLSEKNSYCSDDNQGGEEHSSCEGNGDNSSWKCEETEEDVCSQSSSEDCMDYCNRKIRSMNDPKSIKRKHKDERKKRKVLQKECKKKTKEIIKEFKMKEKQRRRREKDRMKKIARLQKQKDKEEKKCRKERKKCEMKKEKIRRAQENEKLRELKEKLKMRCDTLKYAQVENMEEENQTAYSCLTATHQATLDHKAKRKQCKQQQQPRC